MQVTTGKGSVNSSSRGWQAAEANTSQEAPEEDQDDAGASTLFLSYK